jgi:5-(carboxyamino)imidazole ribonucleotide synthase
VVRTASECTNAVRELGPSIAKTCVGGYDGRGQQRVEREADAHAAWTSLRADRLVVERRVDIEVEVSVLVARRPGGADAVFPVAMNHHENGVLAWSVIPAPIDPALSRRATELGRGVAAALGIEGLLAVEMFVLRDGSLLVNELAPRPHNTFHATERGSVTSQFEQCVRAACDLPLGDPSSIQPAAIVNLLGDVWLGPTPPDLARALGVPATRLHLYGKREARAGRKMGHLSAVGTTADEAKARVLGAYELLKGGTRDEGSGTGGG